MYQLLRPNDNVSLLVLYIKKDIQDVIYDINKDKLSIIYTYICYPILIPNTSYVNIFILFVVVPGGPRTKK